MRRIARFLGLVLVAALASAAVAHEYFHETPNRRGPPSKQTLFPGSGQIEIPVGGSYTIVVEDRGTCVAEVTATMSDPAIATVVGPATKTGKRVSFTFRGTAPGQTTLTFHVVGQGMGVEDGQTVPCTEDSMNPFTICVVPDTSQAEKEFKKRLADLLKEFKASLAARVKQVKTANAQTLFDRQKGTLTTAAADAQLRTNVTSVTSTLNDLWLAQAEAGRQAGREVLAALNIPACASIARGFSFGGGGLWDQFSENLRLAIIQAANSMQADATTTQGKLNTAADPQQATSNRFFFNPSAPTISAPSDPTPLVPPNFRRAVNVNYTSATRTAGSGTGLVGVFGTAAPNTQVVLTVTQGGPHTVTVNADGEGNWQGSISGLNPGSAIVTATYTGEIPNQPATVTIR